MADTTTEPTGLKIKIGADQSLRQVDAIQRDFQGQEGYVRTHRGLELDSPLDEDLPIPFRSEKILSLRQRLIENRNEGVQALTLSDEEIRSLSSDEYIDYLSLLSNAADHDLLFQPRGITSLIFQHLGTITERFTSEVQTYSSTHQSLEIVPSQWEHVPMWHLTRATNHALWCLTKDADSAYDPAVVSQSIEQLYNGGKSADPLLRTESRTLITNLLSLDQKNGSDQQREGEPLAARFVRDSVDLFLQGRSMDDFYAIEDTLDMLSYPHDSLVDDIYMSVMKQFTTEEPAVEMFVYYANRYGAHEAIQSLIEQAIDNEQFAAQLDRLQKIRKMYPGRIYAHLQQHYKALMMDEHYGPLEQVQQFETELILRVFEGEEQLLDIGCGLGRLINSVGKHGKKVSGIDIVPIHVEYAKKANPESKIVLGSWGPGMPFASEFFDGVWSLGRSVLHNKGIGEFEDFFYGLNRVLKPGKKALVDTPNPEKGHYLAYREKLAAAAKELGIRNMERGLIVDTPDGERFFARMAPLKNQFIALAMKNGFDAKVIAEKDYTDPEGYENTNWYWELTKREHPLSFEEEMFIEEWLYTNEATEYEIELEDRQAYLDRFTPEELDELDRQTIERQRKMGITPEMGPEEREERLNAYYGLTYGGQTAAEEI